MKLSFFGATEEVTGSCYLLETSNSKILIDCGLFQGGRLADPKNAEPFKFNPSNIDAVILTHAHLDHIGRVPKLIKEGYKGPIYCTEATADLMEIVLLDSANIMAKESRRGGNEPLFSKADVASALKQIRTVPYDMSFVPADGQEVSLHDAGHILGSAFIVVRAEHKYIVFSGDLGNPPSPIIRFPERLIKADVLVMESTYGGRIHEDPSDRVFKLRRAVLEIIKNKGVLLIPTFAIERAQEILYQLNLLYQERSIPALPVFIDSPMAIRATAIFKKHIELYNTEAMRMLKIDPDLFSFSGVRSTISPAESREIDSYPSPKIIMAGSGMMHGGRMMGHAKTYLGMSNTTLLFVGFQVKGSLGRRLFDGEKDVYIMGSRVYVKAKIKAIGAYSGHADRQGIVRWIGGAVKPPAKIFLIHGEPEQASSLAKHLKEIFKTEVFMPSHAESFTL